MTYYQVKPEYDQRRTTPTHFLIENELYTEKEAQRFRVPVKCVTRREIKRTATYWFFGARYAA